MPFYVLETQTLIPFIQHVVIEADTLEAACEMAVEDEHTECATDVFQGDPRDTTVTYAKMVPPGYDLSKVQADIAGTLHPLSRFIYSEESGPFLYPPDEYASDPQSQAEDIDNG